MKVTKTPIEGLCIITPDVFSDERGFFFEGYQKERYQKLGVEAEFVQDNISFSKKGVLRGLHYQVPPFDQGKLVSVLQGSVLDVAVDIRSASPTFGKYVSVELSAENKKQFFIPSGFAHGFLALEEGTLFQYKCTNVYSKECDRGILWNDPELGIEWGIVNPILSPKDEQHPFWKDMLREF